MDNQQITAEQLQALIDAITALTHTTKQPEFQTRRAVDSMLDIDMRVIREQGAKNG